MDILPEYCKKTVLLKGSLDVNVKKHYDNMHACIIIFEEVRDNYRDSHYLLSYIPIGLSW